MEALKILNTDPACEVVNSRVIAAPVSKLFEAWTNPELLKQWWGPNGFTNTFHEFDQTPGGKWLFTMHGPNGANYLNESEFIEINRNESIVFNHISEPKFQIQASFKSVSKDECNFMFKMIFPSKEACDKLRSFVTEKNEENLDRLEALINSH